MVVQHNYFDNIVLCKGELRLLRKSIMLAQHNYSDNIELYKGELR